MKVVNVDPKGQTREIADTGQVVAFGEEVEVDSDLGNRLLEQHVWAKPTQKAAKAAKEEGEL